jgi:hypothetical protein
LILAPALATAPAPSDAQQAIYDALKVRHPVPACTELAALSDTAAADLLYVVQHAEQPPWAGMRAAQCLLSHHLTDPTVRAAAESWVVDPAARGFAILTFNALDTVAATDPATAVDLASRGIVGPLSADATKRLERATHPDLKALVAAPPTPSAGD